MTRRLLLLLLLPTLLPVSGAADTAPSKAQLEKLKSRISELSEVQNRELRERDSVQASLREAELRISRLTREQRSLEKKASTAQQRLKNLEAEQAVLAAEKRTQLDWLGKTVRASYQARARADRLKAVNGELDELKAIALRVDKARQVLLDKRSDVQRHADKLQGAQKERQTTLASLNRSLDDRGSNLNQLKADQQRLQKLLEDMQRSLNDIPADLGGKPFGKLAGKLPWPVEARISTGYNSRREGALRWQGVIFNAAPGTPVRAIHSGRVVFADWLRGYGLLTIVDHGNGYLTLYGYNQSLLREVGEWVSAGDSLALAGNSGGNRTNGLYFEIRHRGKAVNPTRWCNQRVTLPPLAQN